MIPNLYKRLKNKAMNTSKETLDLHFVAAGGLSVMGSEEILF